MSLYSELKRRNVFRVAIAYLAAAWLLTEVAGTLFPMFGYGDAPARIAVIILIIGFPLFLVFSWVFEFTPEGLKLERDIDRTLAVTRKSGKQLDRIIILLLALAVGYFAVDKFVLEPTRDAELVEETAQQARSEALVESYGEKSIAVLPFVNLSAEPEQEYFSDGISEELLNLLAKIPELRVISRSSAFSFKGKGIAIPDVARQLNVAHVLEGSVRRAGDRVRITAQLIDARSDTHLWSENFDRTLKDIFAVQEEIAAAIGTALKMELALDSGNGRQFATSKAVSSAAYDAYLQGRELIHHRNRDDMEEAIRHLERAVHQDDSFAPAHAQLAIASMLLTSYVSSDRVRARRIAIRHLDRAQALEPDLAEAHAGRALLAQYANDPEGTIANARKALAVNPNYIDALQWLRIALNGLGRHEEAHAILEQMLMIDPLSIVGRTSLAYWLIERRRFEEAHEIADQLIAQSSTAGHRVHVRASFFGEGKLAEALYWALKSLRDGHSHAWNILALVGEYEEARRIATSRVAHWIDANQGRWEEAIEVSQREVQLSPDAVAMVADAGEILYYAGRLEQARLMYERSLELAPEGRSFGPYFTMQLALLRRKAGDEGGAQAVAQLANKEYAESRAAGGASSYGDMVEAMLAAFDHDPDRAIRALQKAVQHGLRWPMFLNDPVFELLHEDRRFVALRKEIEDLLAIEHEKILQLICFNNPVPDNWQPMPETCEGVVERRQP